MVALSRGKARSALAVKLEFFTQSTRCARYAAVNRTFGKSIMHASRARKSSQASVDPRDVRVQFDEFLKIPRRSGCVLVGRRVAGTALPPPRLIDLENSQVYTFWGPSILSSFISTADYAVRVLAWPTNNDMPAWGDPDSERLGRRKWDKEWKNCLATKHG